MSQKDKGIIVEPLKLRITNKSEKPVTRKVRVEHKQPIVGLPKKMLQSMGIILNQELEFVVEFCEANPLRSEIKLRFIRQNPTLLEKVPELTKPSESTK